MQNDKVGNIILKARLEQKMTQKQLADKMGISDKAISKWECGSGNPDISLILKLSNILGIDVRELLKVYEKP
jgi:transcriptional regulator with XRE-family HTH domain